jgi:hypothetical protein
MELNSLNNFGLAVYESKRLQPDAGQMDAARKEITKSSPCHFVTGELKTREFHKFDLDIKSNTYITKL